MSLINIKKFVEVVPPLQPMMLFLDVEWADVRATELVSLALVGDEMTFYAERKPLRGQPTDFVRSTVYPLLVGQHWALSDDVFSQRLREFIAMATARNGRAPTIAYDYLADRSLCKYTYEDFGRVTTHVLNVEWFDLNQLGVEYAVHRERYFSENPLEAQRRHNALVDARASIAGYRGALKALVSK